MNKEILTVKENKPITETVYEMVLSGCSPMLPGQFVEILLPGFSLRRPFSAAEYKDGKLTIYYKLMGRGTESMTAIKKGQKIDALTGLGKGFSLSHTDHPILIGGGVGIAPLFFLARLLSEREKNVKILLCGRSKKDIFNIKEFKKYGEVLIATDDGSLGLKGNAVDITKEIMHHADFYYACGPMPMLKGLSKLNIKGELSLEAHMGCGFGACMGCSIETTNGPKRVCKEGPVFSSDELILN